jgi:hypothetical protein
VKSEEFVIVFALVRRGVRINGEGFRFVLFGLCSITRFEARESVLRVLGWFEQWFAKAKD